MTTAKIMIVEDERIVALDISNHLRSLGYEVVAVVATGEDALLQAERVAPHLALMDVHLEGDLDGIETAHELRQRHGTPSVLLTAYADDDTVRRAGQSLSYGYLVKPCDARELHAAIQVALARAQADRRIAEMNATLEARVAERTRDLSDAMRELEGFAYAMAHDLRTPLRALSGFAGMLLEDYGGALPAEAHRRLKVIDDNALRMGALVDGLLEYIRLGRRTIVRSKVQVDEIVRQVVNGLRHGGGYEGHRFVVGELPPCQGDALLLQEVWANLLENAAKYSSKVAAPRVEAGFERDTQAYFVRDNGAGFDMQYANKLFGVFSRLHSEAEFPGIGAGLAIVQRIVQRHGGTIWAEAALDVGATFRFTVPDPDGG